MNLLLFGPPGAGKGTQANLILKKFNLIQVSTGNLLREEVNKNTLLGKEIENVIVKGNLASDDIVNKLVEEIISNPINKDKIIFDGYPRNLDQAKDLEKLLSKYKQKISVVIYLFVSKESIKKSQEIERLKDSLIRAEMVPFEEEAKKVLKRSKKQLREVK